MCIFHITIESIFFRSSVCTVVKRFTICLSTNVCYCFVVVPLSWQFLPVRLPQCEAGEVVFLIPLDRLPPDGRPIPFPYLNLHPILPRLLKIRKRICSSGWREAQWHTVNCSVKSGPFSWWLEDHYWLGLGVFAVVRSQCSTLNCQLRSEKDVLSVKVNLDVLRNYGQLCKWQYVYNYNHLKKRDIFIEWTHSYTPRHGLRWIKSTTNWWLMAKQVSSWKWLEVKKERNI